LLLDAGLTVVKPPVGATLTVNALAVSVVCLRPIWAASEADIDARNAIVETAADMAFARCAKNHAAVCLSLIGTPGFQPEGIQFVEFYGAVTAPCH
jgi:hypothetical protein